jgi:hypothetical protein
MFIQPHESRHPQNGLMRGGCECLVLSHPWFLFLLEILSRCTIWSWLDDRDAGGQLTVPHRRVADVTNHSWTGNTFRVDRADASHLVYQIAAHTTSFKSIHYSGSIHYEVFDCKRYLNQNVYSRFSFLSLVSLIHSRLGSRYSFRMRGAYHFHK